MADLVTRLLLDDKQFNDNIRRSRRQTQDFNKGVSKLRGGMIGLAGTLGVAVTANAAFMKALDGSQKLGDTFRNSMEASKTSVDEFFSSMVTGDFTTFTTGIREVYKNALLAQEALDQLGNTQISFGVVSNRTRMEMQDARQTALDREASPEDREAAMTKWREKLGELQAQTKTLQQDLVTTVSAQLSTSSALDPESITLQDAFDVFKIDISTPKAREAAKKQAEEDFKAYQKEYHQAVNVGATVSTTIIPGAGGTSSVSYKDESLQAGKEIAKRYKDTILIHSMLEKMTDDQLTAVGAKIQQHDSLSTSISQELEKINRATHRVKTQTKETITGGKGEEVINEGSLKAINEQIKKANDALLNATTAAARRTWTATIKELEAEKVQIEIEYKFTKPKGDIDKVGTSVSTSPTIDVSNLPIAPIEQGGETISAFENYMNILEGARKKNEEFILSAYTMGDALHSIAGATEGSASEWLGWGANVLGSIGTAIPAIMALTEASKASATAAAADAAAKGAGSVAAIPFVGPILAVGAITSIAAALASLPKYEMGGIIGGSSYSGDKMLARVNSGEMVLNKGQQGNLFKMINNGGGTNLGGNVKFRIHRNELVGMLEQDRQRRSRI